MVDPRYDVTRRELDAHERPREGNDPRRLDTQTAYYRGYHTHWLKLLIVTAIGLTLLAFIGFIVFNLLFS